MKKNTMNRLGSAGILPAAAGILPGARARTQVEAILETFEGWSCKAGFPATCRKERAECPRSPAHARLARFPEVGA